MMVDHQEETNPPMEMEHRLVMMMMMKDPMRKAESPKDL